MSAPATVAAAATAAAAPAADAAAASSSAAAAAAPAPVLVESVYTHTTFLSTLTSAFTRALLSASAEVVAALPAGEELTPEYYVEATKAALRQVLTQQYDAAVSAAYSATFTQSAGGVIEPDRSPVAPAVDELDSQSSGAEAGAAAAPAAGAPKRKPIRTYIDGCFDIMHSGHYNAIRQAKALTDILVVGVHSDEEIRKHKGPPVMNDAERLATVNACKWVDEVVFGTPYDPSLELLVKLNCDYCVHGDDMSTTADGRDAYAEVKEAGRMKVVKRTEGVSTTDLVGRLLLMTRSHHINSPALAPLAAAGAGSGSSSPSLVALSSKLKEAAGASPPSLSLEPSAASASPPPAHPVRKSSDVARPPASSSAAARARSPEKATPPAASDSKPISNFLPTTWRITQFSNHKTPSASDRIVYIDGAFDLFHVGHIDTLRKAKQLGTFLYVGIHDDATVNLHKGRNYPIMNLHERVMNVLSCKYVDEVVIGAPWVVTKDLITTLNLHIVASGSSTKMDQDVEASVSAGGAQMGDAYAIPKSMGIYREIDSTSSLTTEDVVRRLIKNRQEYEQRNAKRAPKEEKYNAQKTFIAEI